MGLVMASGFPVAHHVFEGNRRDRQTVSQIVKTLSERFQVRRLVFVGDRGMVTAETRTLLKGQSDLDPRQAIAAYNVTHP